MPEDLVNEDIESLVPGDSWMEGVPSCAVQHGSIGVPPWHGGHVVPLNVLAHQRQVVHTSVHLVGGLHGADILWGGGRVNSVLL